MPDTFSFSDKVQNYFRTAGWTPGHNSLDTYKDLPVWEEIPAFLRTFLSVYGNLEIIQTDAETVPVRLSVTPNFLHKATESDHEHIPGILGFDIFIFARQNPDGYYTGCDAEGNVYMLGDYYFLWASSLQEGIEKILTDNWKGVKQLDEDTTEWKLP